MNQSRLEWDGQWREGLRILRVSRIEDVSYSGVNDAVAERELQVTCIESRSRLTDEKPAPDANRHARLTGIEIPDLKALLRRLRDRE